jgi:UDP-N-acetylmuramoyl-L-alanyl-D-glutamate--2,6-diaminopimelate ligase
MNAAARTAMNLQQLFAGMDLDVPPREVTDIATDSRDVVANGLFLACQGGAHHGLEFLDQALSAGAGAVAWEPRGLGKGRFPRLPADITGIRVPNLQRRIGTLADRFFAAPSSAIAVIGITGTNGKTTTAWLVAQALGSLGRKAGYMGTLGYGLGASVRPAALTTPDCVTVHRRLRELADAGAGHVVAEVSSHALDQRRIDGVRFRAVAFTNLSRDHLDYHGDLERYGASKARLFTDYQAPVAVINVGDPFGRSLAALVQDSMQVRRVALAGTEGYESASWLRGAIRHTGSDGLEIELHAESGDALLKSPLWGRFNADNLLLAAGILLTEGIGLAEAAHALGSAVAPPGRMQRIDGQSGPVVLVDFAHTPDALRKALTAVREHAGGSTWCVFGCGGNRDRGKRPQMGSVACELADRVILTDDNPRDEDPQQIIADILAGVADVARVQVVPDREAAITRAIRSAGPGDVVLVAGKGHEQEQILRDRRRPFSDAAIASAAMGGCR